MRSMAKTMPAGHMFSKARCALLAIFAASRCTSVSPTSNGSYAQRSAAPRQMASHEQQRKAFAIGVSLTQQDAVLPNGKRCHWCQEAEDGLSYFRGSVNTGDFFTSDNFKIIVKLETRFDDGNPMKVQQNYEELGALNSQLDSDNIETTKPIYAFFGPCWSGFNYIAAQVALKYDVLLITWAFFDWNYFTAPGPVMRPANFETGTLRTAYEELGGVCNGYGCTLMQHWSTIGEPHHDRRLGFETPYDRSQETNPDGDIWNAGYTNLIDINVPRSTWAYDAIKRVYQAGARKFTFIYQPNQENGASWWRQCSGLQEYTYANFPGVVANLLEIYPLGKHAIQQKDSFAKSIHQLDGAAHDALVVCGDYWRNVLFVTAIKLFKVENKAVIFDTPMDSFFVNAVKGFNANYFLDPLPMSYNSTRDCDLFGNLFDFEDGMKLHLMGMGRSQTSVGYASMQTAAAGALLIDAFSKLPREPLETKFILSNRTGTTEAIAEYLKTSTISTFWGNMRFERSGKRIATALTRQFLPAPRKKNSAQEEGFTMEERYYLARIKIVDENASLHCNVKAKPDDVPESEFISGEAANATRVQSIYQTCSSSPLVYPSLSWEAKELQIYPCTPGCSYKDHACYACPRGKFRSAQELVCQDCPPGTFASVAGLSACVACPVHGDCTVNDMQPQPQVGFYPIPNQGNISFDRDAIWAAKTDENDNACVDPTRVPNTILRFRHCHGGGCSGQNGRYITGYEAMRMPELDSTCAGMNMGVLCGQCHPGHSFHGFRSGLRMCQACHSRIRLVLTALGIILLFTLAGMYLSQAAASSGIKVSSLACPLVRYAVHHWQLAGFLFEAIGMDDDSVISYFVMPFEIIIRPFDVAQVQCLRENNNSFSSTQDLVYVALLAVPCSAGAIMLYHAVKAFLHGLSVFSKGLVKVTEGTKRVCCGLCASKGNHNEKEDPRTNGTTNGNVDDETKISHLPDIHTEEVVVASPSKPSKTGEDKEYWVTSGPGKSFATMHEGFAVQDTLANIFREMLCMLFLMYPVVLRCTFQANACEEFSPGGVKEERLMVNYDILCDSPRHEEILAGVTGVQWTIGIGLPGALLVFDLWAQEYLFGIRFRQMFSLFYSGYKPDFFFWQVVVFLRMLLLIWVGSTVSNQLYRALLLATIFSLSFVVNLACHPFEKNDRKVLHTLDRRLHIVLIVTCCVGFVVKCDEGDDQLADLFGELSKTTKRGLMGAAVAMNYFLTLNVLGVMLYNQVSLVLKAIIMQSETDVDKTSILFHQFVRKTFRGMNEMQLMTDRHDQPLMDICNLDDDERNFLSDCLTETMSACIDSGRIFHTWLLQNAVHKAFERALEARQANLRALYEKHGTLNFPLLRLGPFTLFWVSLRPPDIKPDIKAVKESHLAGQETEWTLVLDDTSKHRIGVTVEEIFTALASVNVDILSRFPDLFQEPKKIEEVTTPVAEVKDAHQSVIWQAGASFQYLLERLEAAGTLNDTGFKADRLAHPDDEFFAWMANDMSEAERQQTAAYDHSLRQMESCENNVAHLRERLAEEDPVTSEKEMEIKQEMDAVETQIDLLRKFLQTFRFIEENQSSAFATIGDTTARTQDMLSTDRSGPPGSETAGGEQPLPGSTTPPPLPFRKVEKKTGAAGQRDS